MQPIQDLALVLKKTPYQDRDLIVVAITKEHGQLTALAKNGVQSRRFGGTLEPCTLSQWSFT